MGARTLSKKTGLTVPEDLTTYTPLKDSPRHCSMSVSTEALRGSTGLRHRKQQLNQLAPCSLFERPLGRSHLWEDAENVTNRTVKAPPKTGQNAAPGGISRPQLALRGTTWHKPRALDLVGVGTPPRFPPARLAAGPVRLRARHPL